MDVNKRLADTANGRSRRPRLERPSLSAVLRYWWTPFAALFFFISVFQQDGSRRTYPNIQAQLAAAGHPNARVWGSFSWFCGKPRYGEGRFLWQTEHAEGDICRRKIRVTERW